MVRGVRGTYTKCGIDVQEEQLKAITSPSEILQSPTYGKEPEQQWGTLENLVENDKVVKSMLVTLVLNLR